MRAAWWLVKLAWRTGARVRRIFGPSEPHEHPTDWLTTRAPDAMGGPLERPTVTLIGNLNDVLERVPGRAVDRELEQLEELARKARA